MAAPGRGAAGSLTGCTDRVTRFGARGSGSCCWPVAGQRHWGHTAWAMSQENDLGSDSVLRLGRIRVTGRTSGVEMESQFAQHVVMRDGLIVSSRDYLSHADALEAARLRE